MKAQPIYRVTIPDLAIPEREGGYAKGQEMREQILHAALGILIEEGYRAMTMRRVAASCAMKLGNLTYYYPTREDLVRDLLESVIGAYESAFDVIAHKPGLSAEGRLEGLCRLILDDIRTKKTTRIFPELWALANHDAFVSDRVYEMYERPLRFLIGVVREMRPDLTDEQSRLLSLFVAASMEGMTIFAGYQKPFVADMGRIENIAVRSFIDLVRTIRPEGFDRLIEPPRPPRAAAGKAGGEKAAPLAAQAS